jgi:hypothetical protein
MRYVRRNERLNGKPKLNTIKLDDKELAMHNLWMGFLNKYNAEWIEQRRDTHDYKYDGIIVGITYMPGPPDDLPYSDFYQDLLSLLKNVDATYTFALRKRIKEGYI